MATIWTDGSGALGNYVTGGFTVPTTLTAVDFAAVEIEIPGANLGGPVLFTTSRSGANFTFKIMVGTYDKTTAIGSVTGLPSGVTLATVSGQTYTADVTHIHDMTHDHPLFISGNAVAGAGGVVIDAVGSKDVLGHNHSTNIPNFIGNTGVGGTHTHTWNDIYEHAHAITNTPINSTYAELANGTVLGLCRLLYIAGTS